MDINQPSHMDILHKISELSTQVAVLNSHVDNNRNNIAKSEKKLDKIETSVLNIEKQANKWKGGFIMILMFGGLIGWTVDKLMKFINITPTP